MRSIVSACQIKFDWRSWWRERRDLFTPVQRLSLFSDRCGYFSRFTSRTRQSSLSQVLKGEIEAENIRDRLILIGSTAESLKDSFYTPYSHGWFRPQEKMSGVFIHANVTSQIISAALNNRPLLRTPSKVISLLWVFFWSFISAVILWRSLFLRTIALNLAIARVLLIITCYLAFLFGWWLPLIPALLSLNTTAIVAIFIRNRQQERLRFQHTLAALLPESNSLVGKIALEYFKRSENEDNQIIIEQNLYSARSIKADTPNVFTDFD